MLKVHLKLMDGRLLEHQLFHSVKHTFLSYISIPLKSIKNVSYINNVECIETDRWNSSD